MALERINVLKFGGSSVADAKSIQQSCEAVKQHVDQGENLVVVLSAMAGVTNGLLHAYNDATKGSDQTIYTVDGIEAQHIQAIEGLAGSLEASSAKEHISEVTEELRRKLGAIADLGGPHRMNKDIICSAGEQMIPPVFALGLDSMGIPAAVLDAKDVMVTDGQFSDANPVLGETSEKLRSVVLPELNRGKVALIGGFYGADAKGTINTFSRGGSDRSATIFARALHQLGLPVNGVYLYKGDEGVGGIMSADPRIVKDARVIDHLTRRFTAILAGLGGKVIHSKAVQELDTTDIPIFCKSTVHFDEPGTIIDDKERPDDPDVQVITAQIPLSLLRVEGMGMDRTQIAYKIFQLLAGAEIDVRAILQPVSEQVIHVVLPSNVDQKFIEKQLRISLMSFLGEGDISSIDVTSGGSAVGAIGKNVNSRGAMEGIARALYQNGGSASSEHILTTFAGSNLYSVVYQNDPGGSYAKEAVQSMHKELINP